MNRNYTHTAQLATTVNSVLTHLQNLIIFYIQIGTDHSQPGEIQ